MRWTWMIFSVMEQTSRFPHARTQKSSIKGLMSFEEAAAASKLHVCLLHLLFSPLIRAIAWSNWGCIATITSNGAALELRNLRCHPATGDWGLSEPTVTPAFTTTLDGGPLKHLSWSPTGSELAVVDSAGRVTILSIFSSLNKPTLHRPGAGDPADDLYGVVGCYWLNLGPYPPGRPVSLRPSFGLLFLPNLFSRLF